MRFRSSSAIDADCVVCSYIKRKWKRKWYVPFRSTTPPLLILELSLPFIPLLGLVFITSFKPSSPPSPTARVIYSLHVGWLSTYACRHRRQRPNQWARHRKCDPPPTGTSICAMHVKSISRGTIPPMRVVHPALGGRHLPFSGDPILPQG